jgi:hypothetical protein
VVGIGVALSLFVRIVFNIFDLLSIKNELYDSYVEDTWLFPFHLIVIVIIGSLIPIGSITFSLLYGLRQRRKIRRRKATKIKQYLPLADSGDNGVVSAELEEVDPSDDGLSTEWGGLMEEASD